MLCSKLLPVAPIGSKPTDFERVITGDKSWFFRYYPGDWVWAESHDDVPPQLKPRRHKQTLGFDSFVS
jgi:hypothetical protein